MNLLLMEPSEVSADGLAVVADRRAIHLRTVLGVKPGSSIRAGVLGGGIGTAEILSDDGGAIALRITATALAPSQLEVELVLALPRPKVLSRVIEACAAFGVRRIDLTNAWRVDKSYLKSPRLEPATLAHAARLGAEQGATTHVPEIHVHERLMSLLDERFAGRRPEMERGGLAPTLGVAERLIAHPGAPAIERVVTAQTPTIIAIGPEGGWIERELETFVARGFKPVSIGTPILRVETAVAAVLGQFLMIDRLRER